jgi:CubicO group peptidase (beta-lactamase class C family)
VARALAARLAAAPGARHAYSNLGFSLLAAVVEIASGEPYAAFMDARLFRPAGLRETGYAFAPSMRARLAAGYRDGARWGIGVDSTAATHGEFWNLLGNGGLQSSAEDLHRWARALLAGRVLPPAAVAELMAPHVLAIREYREPGAPLYYGYGWYVWKRPGASVVFHDGGNGVFYASLRLYPDDGRVLAYGSNVSTFTDVTFMPVPALDRIMLGDSTHLPPAVLPLASSSARWVGRYADASGREALRVERDGAALRITAEGQSALTFLHAGAWTADPTLDSLNARATRFMALSRGGESDALGHFVRPAALEQVRRVEESFWRRRDSTLGPHVATRVLGTRPGRSRRSPFPATTYVAAEFARGTAYREFTWDSTRTIVDYGPVDAPPGRLFFATSPGCVATFEVAVARTDRICFVGRGGAITAEATDRRGSRLLRRAP